MPDSFSALRSCSASSEKPGMATWHVVDSVCSGGGDTIILICGQNCSYNRLSTSHLKFVNFQVFQWLFSVYSCFPSVLLIHLVSYLSSTCFLGFQILPSFPVSLFMCVCTFKR
jgi:hypothetical protein